MDAMESTVERAEDGAVKPWLWHKGQSGNPSGRPKGAKNKATLWAEALETEHGEEVLALLLKRAREGDGAALRFLAARFLPPAKHQRVAIELPEDELGHGPARDAAAAGRAVLRAAFAGDLAPAEAQTLFALIDRQKMADVHARLEEEREEQDAADDEEADDEGAGAAETPSAAGATPSQHRPATPRGTGATVFSTVFPDHRPASQGAGDEAREGTGARYSVTPSVRPSATRP